MTFQELYTEKVLTLIQRQSAQKQNLIFVLLGQTDLISSPKIEKYATDLETFNLNANEEQFNKEWFTKVFTALNIPKELHILSYPQFSYLISYIDSSFFKDRVIVIKDNLRLLYPIAKKEYYENTQDENIEERPDNLPIYQSEQLQIKGQYFYAVRLPTEDYLTLDIFQEQKILEESTNEELEAIDIVSDNLALDNFINECILENTFDKKAIVNIHAKQPVSDTIVQTLSKVNSILAPFGGSIFRKKDEEVIIDYKVSRSTNRLLKKYWGKEAKFRELKVYKNPDLGKQISAISQGLIVETIISEYKNAKEGKDYRDLFLTAPTGAGKSLLFQLPAFFVSSKSDVTIVVSPLIALMKDQVNAIITDRQFEKIAYLNSELSLIDREKIIESCHKGEIDILYMSPELMLSYSITHFIGERKLGLLVIDEAHLITTWGRDFRVDYWFLGSHIRKIRKYSEMSFPMVAVTATAIYGGSNDMVFDSIDSLVMHNPHIFIGQVKRQDITFVINNYEKFANKYQKNKLEQTVNFIKEVHKTGLKVLVYTPYTKHVKDILTQLRSEDLNIATEYYGKLPKELKELSYREFKSGQKKIMVSTKAFGMGVDIPDIELVYHHAPSGLLPDYIQEIGRVARKSSIQGFAALNYTSQDKRFTKALHGMSALHQFQLKEVLKKIFKTYIKNNKSRNLLLSVDDFGHIFDDASDLDQKVLTALMMIEKDYLAKHRFNVLIARPKKLFVKVYARISDQELPTFNNIYPNCSRRVASLANGNNIIEVNLDELWYKHFSDRSFPKVKYAFYKGGLFKRDGIELIPQLKISFERTKSFAVIYGELKQLFDNLKAIFSRLQGSFFNQDQLIKLLNIHIDDKSKSEKIGKFILSSYSGRLIQPGVIESNAFLQSRREGGGYKYRVFNQGYLASFSILLKRLNNLFSNTEASIVNRYVTNRESNSTNYVRLGYFLEMLELGTFEIKGGENPMVFIRINDPSRIERDSTSYNYSNTLLSKTLERHYLSNQIFDHFFLRSFSNAERWDFIEDFFLGLDVDSLIEQYQGGDENKVNLVEYLETHANPEQSAPVEINDKSTVHIFFPKKSTHYNVGDLLTIEDNKEKKTMKVSQWIAEDPILFDKTMSKFNFFVDKNVFLVLTSKLMANHFEYYKKSRELNVRISFKGYDKPVKALVPYKNQPIKFYQWWIKNTDKVHLGLQNKLQLLNKVALEKPKLLRAKDKDLLNKIKS